MTAVTKADVVELADELNTGDTVETTVSFEVNFWTDERETETYEFVVAGTSHSEYGARLTFKREETYSTKHGSIDCVDQNTSDDFPAFLYAGMSKYRSKQDKCGCVEELTRVSDDASTDTDTKPSTETDVAADADDDESSPVDIDVGCEYDTGVETVELTNERDGEMCIYHPDREPVEATAYTVWRPRESVEAVAARESWEYIDTDGDSHNSDADVNWLQTPTCPVCSQFMSQDIDGNGLPAEQGECLGARPRGSSPAAQCSRLGYGGFLSDRDRVDEGDVRLEGQPQ